MDVKEALIILDTALASESLSDLQELVFRNVWEGKTYPQIAAEVGYDANYVKDVGSKLWKLLSTTLGEPVSKSNVQAVCRRYASQHPPIQIVNGIATTPKSGSPQRLECETSSLGTRSVTVDWGEAIDVPVFYGRTDELAKLNHWIGTEQCRLVALLGMGGMGKTSLSVKVAEQLQDQFEFVIWRSLRNGPALETLLADLLWVLSQQTTVELPETVDGRISLLLEYLRTSRCLLILDNAETVLQSHDRTAYGQSELYRSACDSYSTFWQRMGETRHQSCLLVTSREKPKALIPLEGDHLPVRSLQLSGLSKTDGQALIQLKGCFSEAEADWNPLIDCYAGNPLALVIVATVIDDLFDGNISKFLTQGVVIFADIRDLLDEQFNRLSELEQVVLYWLAINREDVSFTELSCDIFQPLLQSRLLEAMGSLGRRSLVEKVTPPLDDQQTRKSTGFTLQPVVMDYVVDRFIEQICEEITTLKPHLFKHHALIKAQAKDYIRDAQIQLILHPIAERLLSRLGSKTSVEAQLSLIRAGLQDEAEINQGYAAGNILNLLNDLQADLRGYDFSHLAVWQAYLPSAHLAHVNFAGADLSRSVFADQLSAVVSVAFSPNGQHLVTADAQGAIRLWRVEDGKPYITYNGHQSWVWSVVFHPGGQQLMSASEDQTLRIWDVETGQCLQTLQNQTGRIWAIACHPQQPLIASSGEDWAITLWDLNTGQCDRTLRGHDGEVCAIAFHPTQDILASAGEDQIIRLWNLSTGECWRTFQGHMGWIWTLAFSPDGTQLASAGDDGSVQIWTIETDACVHLALASKSRIWALAFHPNGQQVVTGGDDQRIRLWDIPTQTCLKVLAGHTGRIWTLALNADGQTLASGSEDQTVKIWNLQTGLCLKTLKGYTNWVCEVAFCPDGQRVVSGGEDGAVRVWDLKTGSLAQTLEGHLQQVWSVATSADGQTLASASEDQTIRIWDLASGQCLYRLQGHTSRIWAVAFAPDGQRLASGSGDRTIKLWDVKTGTCLQTLTGHQSRVWTVAFSPDGKWLASGSGDRTIKLWDVATGQCLRTLTGHKSWVLTVAFNPNGPTLLSGGGDGALHLWDVETGQCLKTLMSEAKLIWSVAWSLDGSRIASGGDDRIATIWDANTGECLYTCIGHTGWIWSLALSPDGQTVVTGSQDGTLKLWRVASGELLKTLQIEKLYEGMNIYGATGLTAAQSFTLKTLGAIESPLARPSTLVEIHR
jgi:WD40 repeat protein